MLKEKRGFKYNLKTSVTLKRWNNATNSYDIIIRHLGTDPKTVINQRFNLNSANEELKHKQDIWAGEGSGWIIDRLEAIFIDITNYNPLAGSNYIPSPPELDHPMKGSINIKNKDDKCFKLCRIRLLNYTKRHPERIKKQDKKRLQIIEGLISL